MVQKNFNMAAIEQFQNEFHEMNLEKWECEQCTEKNLTHFCSVCFYLHATFFSWNFSLQWSEVLYGIHILCCSKKSRYNTHMCLWCLIDDHESNLEWIQVCFLYWFFIVMTCRPTKVTCLLLRSPRNFCSFNNFLDPFLFITSEETLV